MRRICELEPITNCCQSAGWFYCLFSLLVMYSCFKNSRSAIERDSMCHNSARSPRIFTNDGSVERYQDQVDNYEAKMQRNCLLREDV